MIINGYLCLGIKIESFYKFDWESIRSSRYSLPMIELKTQKEFARIVFIKEAELGNLNICDVFMINTNQLSAYQLRFLLFNSPVPQKTPYYLRGCFEELPVDKNGVSSYIEDENKFLIGLDEDGKKFLENQGATLVETLDMTSEIWLSLCFGIIRLSK